MVIAQDEFTRAKAQLQAMEKDTPRKLPALPEEIKQQRKEVDTLRKFLSDIQLCQVGFLEAVKEARKAAGSAEALAFSQDRLTKTDVGLPASQVLLQVEGAMRTAAATLRGVTHREPEVYGPQQKVAMYLALVLAERVNEQKASSPEEKHARVEALADTLAGDIDSPGFDRKAFAALIKAYYRQKCDGTLKLPREYRAVLAEPGLKWASLMTDKGAARLGSSSVSLALRRLISQSVNVCMPGGIVGSAWGRIRGAVSAGLIYQAGEKRVDSLRKSVMPGHALPSGTLSGARKDTWKSLAASTAEAALPQVLRAAKHALSTLNDIRENGFAHTMEQAGNHFVADNLISSGLTLAAAGGRDGAEAVAEFLDDAATRNTTNQTGKGSSLPGAIPLQHSRVNGSRTEESVARTGQQAPATNQDDVGMRSATRSGELTSVDKKSYAVWNEATQHWGRLDECYEVRGNPVQSDWNVVQRNNGIITLKNELEVIEMDVVNRKVRLPIIKNFENQYFIFSYSHEDAPRIPVIYDSGNNRWVLNGNATLLPGIEQEHLISSEAINIKPRGIPEQSDNKGIYRSNTKERYIKGNEGWYRLYRSNKLQSYLVKKDDGQYIKAHYVKETGGWQLGEKVLAPAGFRGEGDKLDQQIGDIGKILSRGRAELSTEHQREIDKALSLAEGMLTKLAQKLKNEVSLTLDDRKLIFATLGGRGNVNIQELAKKYQIVLDALKSYKIGGVNADQFVVFRENNGAFAFVSEMDKHQRIFVGEKSLQHSSDLDTAVTLIHELFHSRNHVHDHFYLHVPLGQNMTREGLSQRIDALAKRGTSYGQGLQQTNPVSREAAIRSRQMQQMRSAETRDDIIQDNADSYANLAVVLTKEWILDNQFSVKTTQRN
ncbi:Uncharacterised protein [Serratia quinivorans]|nr:Uncharacterised protein [Serratia quinivorans]